MELFVNRTSTLSLQPASALLDAMLQRAGRKVALPETGEGSHADLGFQRSTTTH
jgi:hypothetical protein